MPLSNNLATGGRAGPRARNIVRGRRCSFTGQSSGGYSFHTAMAFPWSVLAIRLNAANSASSDIAGYSCIFGWSDNVSNVNTPSAGWNETYFSGVTSTATPVTVPKAALNGGSNSAVLSYLQSDWHFVPSVPRADGLPGCVLHLRDYWATGVGTRGTTNTAGTLAADGYFATFQSGDNVTTNRGGFTATGFNPGSNIEVEMLLADGSIVTSILNIRDSIGQGYDDTTFGGWMARSAAILSATSGKTLNLIDGATSGSSSAGFTANARNALDLFVPPNIAIYCPGSPNDTSPAKYTATWRQQVLGQLYLVLDKMVHRAVPTVAIATLAPETSITALQESVRVATNADIVAAAVAANAVLLPFSDWWTDPYAAVGGWKPGFQGSALVHPSPLACADVTPRVAALLQPYV